MLFVGTRTAPASALAEPDAPHLVKITDEGKVLAQATFASLKEAEAFVADTLIAHKTWRQRKDVKVWRLEADRSVEVLSL